MNLPLRHKFRIRRSSSLNGGWMTMVLIGLIGFQITRNYPRPDRREGNFSGFSFALIPLNLRPGQHLPSLFHWETYK